VRPTYDTLTRRLVHPTAPVLLTRGGPLTAENLERPYRPVKRLRLLSHSEFESGPRERAPPVTPINISTATVSVSFCHSDPEGTFGRNQQLTGSMSLSPLHPGETSDLHVSTAFGPPARFLKPWPFPGEAHRFSGISLPTQADNTRACPCTAAPVDASHESTEASPSSPPIFPAPRGTVILSGFSSLPPWERLSRYLVRYACPVLPG